MSFQFPPQGQQQPSFTLQSPPQTYSSSVGGGGVRVNLPDKPLLASVSGVSSILLFVASFIFLVVYVGKLPSEKNNNNQDTEEVSTNPKKKEEQAEEDEEKKKKARIYLYLCIFSALIGVVVWVAGKVSTHNWKNNTTKAILSSGYDQATVDMLLKSQSSSQMSNSISSVGKSLSTGLIVSSLLK